MCFLSRFLFCLQVKRDLASGVLQCNDNTAAIMASYIVQGMLRNKICIAKRLTFKFLKRLASCGDYVAEDYPDHTYLSSYRFVPNQDASMQRRIMDSHKKHM